MTKNIFTFSIILSLIITQPSYTMFGSSNSYNGEDEIQVLSTTRVQPQANNDRNTFVDFFDQRDFLIDRNSPEDFSADEQLSDPFLKAVRRYFNGSRDVDGTPCVKWRVRLLKAFAILVGATAGIPYFSPACQASSRSPILPNTDLMCYTFGASTVISYGGLCVWVGLRLADRFASQNADEKKVNLIRKRFKSTRVPHWLSRTVYAACGIASSIPGVWTVFKYNQNKFYLISSVLVEVTIKIEGCFTFTERMRAMVGVFKNSSSETKIKSDKLKKNLALSIYRGIDNGIPPSRSLQNAFRYIVDVYDFDDLDEPPSSLQKGKFNRRLKAAVQTAFMIFPIGNEILRLMLTNDALSALIPYQSITVPLSILISIPGLALDTLGTVRTSGNIYDTIHAKITKSVNPNYMNHFFWKTTILICVSSFVLAILSTAGDAYVAYDTAKHSLFPKLMYALPILVFVNNAIFETFGLINLSQDTAIEVIGKCGGSKLGNAVHITRGYEYAISVIDTVNPEDFALDDL